MKENRQQHIYRLLDDGGRLDEAFMLIMDQFSKPIYWHLRRMVVRHEDAEDVMQEAFMSIYRALGSFRRESSLKTWIYRIATNEALHHCSKKRLSTNSYDEKSGLVDLFEAEPQVDFTSAEAALQRAILSLPEKQRVVFNLRYYDEMSYEQIAQVTGSSLSTLKTNYHYASGKIKEYIKNSIEL